MNASDFEKLGAFYLGRAYDLAADRLDEGPLLYDSGDLTTHAVIVGMTGSGKTGLAISLLEEAAIDGIPVIAIDPKGDLPNLLLTFPELRAATPAGSRGRGAARGRNPTRSRRPPRRAGATACARQDGARIAPLRRSRERIVWTPEAEGVRSRCALVRRTEAACEAEALREPRAGAFPSAGAGVHRRDNLRSREHSLLDDAAPGAWRRARPRLAR